MYVFSDTVSELKDKKSSKLQEAFLSTLRCPDTSYALWGLWARTCLQQHHHFILRLWIVCSVTCRLQRRLRCLCFREAALLCIKCTVLHPQLCFHSTLLLLPRHPKEDQMFPSVSGKRCSGTAQVSRAARFVRYLCQVVFIRARIRPICRLGCQPSPSSQQVFCAVPLCYSQRLARFGRRWQIALDSPSTQSTAQHSSAEQTLVHTQKLNTHICNAQVCAHTHMLSRVLSVLVCGC